MSDSCFLWSSLDDISFELDSCCSCLLQRSIAGLYYSDIVGVATPVVFGTFYVVRFPFIYHVIAFADLCSSLFGCGLLICPRFISASAGFAGHCRCGRKIAVVVEVSIFCFSCLSLVQVDVGFAFSEYIAPFMDFVQRSCLFGSAFFSAWCPDSNHSSIFSLRLHSCSSSIR